MELERAKEILQSLHDGVDPFTGEIYEPGSPFQNPDVVRALSVALQAISRQIASSKRQKSCPEKAGKPWTQDEDAALLGEFEAGSAVKDLARIHARTTGAIQSRLIKLGKLPPVAGPRNVET